MLVRVRYISFAHTRSESLLRYISDVGVPSETRGRVDFKFLSLLDTVTIPHFENRIS